MGLFSRRNSTKSTRYYYSDEEIFEKSLDIVKPKERVGLSENQPLPVVFLVVGSGWVGHRAWIYRQTSWWNSSGPQAIASLGCTCVCIRHRGTYFLMPPASSIGPWLVALWVFLLVVCGDWLPATLAVTGLAFSLIALALSGRGCAKFEDMLNDVAQALQWINKHQELLPLLNNGNITSTAEAEVSFSSPPVKRKSSMVPPGEAVSSGTESSSCSLSLEDSSQQANGTTSNSHFAPVFGGYSSGGHVAATLLQNPQIMTEYGLPPPQEFFGGVLLISGVLAVRPVSANNVNSVPSYRHHSVAQRWLTDFGMRLVFGDRASTIPSPLDEICQRPDTVPRLPHLVVGCRNEIFGLPWLDVLFCSGAYCEQLQSTFERDTDAGDDAKEHHSIRITYRQVESDHWSILNSKVLRETLQEELPKLSNTRN